MIHQLEDSCIWFKFLKIRVNSRSFAAKCFFQDKVNFTLLF